MPSSASNSRIIDPDGQAAESGGRAGDVGSEKEEFISNGLVRLPVVLCHCLRHCQVILFNEHTHTES